MLFICLIFYRFWIVEFCKVPGNLAQAPGLPPLILWSPYETNMEKAPLVDIYGGGPQLGLIYLGKVIDWT